MRIQPKIFFAVSTFAFATSQYSKYAFYEPSQLIDS